jgi:hypothetical protein
VISGGGMQCMQAADGIDMVVHAKLGTPYYRGIRTTLLGKLVLVAVVEVIHIVEMGRSHRLPI